MKLSRKGLARVESGESEAERLITLSPEERRGSARRGGLAEELVEYERLPRVAGHSRGGEIERDLREIEAVVIRDGYRELSGVARTAVADHVHDEFARERRRHPQERSNRQGGEATRSRHRALRRFTA